MSQNLGGLNTGSHLGGLGWGSIVDGERSYVANPDAGGEEWTLIDEANIHHGFWSVLNASTGETLWQTENRGEFVNQELVTIANGVAVGCSLDADGFKHVMDAATDQVPLSVVGDGSCNGTLMKGGTSA